MSTAKSVHRSVSHMTIGDAVTQCRETGLSGWALVEYAQKLVSGQMSYSYSNSFDFPATAFEKGRGYCWHQANALNKILSALGLDSRRVHAVKNRIPAKQFEGVNIEPHISGHIWLRVSIGGEEKDVCPGHPDNAPGCIHFTPVSKVRQWNAFIAFWSYLGSAMVNAQRLRRIDMKKKKLKERWNPDACSCKKKNCPRYKKCDECKEYHYSRQSLPYCER